MIPINIEYKKYDTPLESVMIIERLGCRIIIYYASNIYEISYNKVIADKIYIIDIDESGVFPTAPTSSLSVNVSNCTFNTLTDSESEDIQMIALFNDFFVI